MNPAPVHELSCPNCDQPVSVTAANLTERQPVRCLACGSEAVADKEMDEHTGSWHWKLFDVEDVAPDERAE